MREQKAGTAVPSFTSRMLENDLNEYEEDAVKWAANSMYGGGTDTVRTLFLSSSRRLY